MNKSRFLRYAWPEDPSGGGSSSTKDDTVGKVSQETGASEKESKDSAELEQESGGDLSDDDPGDEDTSDFDSELDAEDDAHDDSDKDDDSWASVFPGKSAQQVAEEFKQLRAERDKFKRHSRTWEERAKKSKPVKEELESLAAHAQSIQKAHDAAVAEMALVRRVAALDPSAVDSISFMEQARRLDPEKDTYSEELKALVVERSKSKPLGGVMRHFNREVGSSGSGLSLWDELHPSK